jgi:hypothetical protein
MLSLLIKEVKEMVKIEDLIERAKEDVVCAVGEGGSRQRRWLEANVDSYNSSTFRIKVLVLEGSEPRGWVIVNYYLKFVQAFGKDGKMLSEYELISEQLKEYGSSERRQTWHAIAGFFRHDFSRGRNGSLYQRL